MKIMLFQTAFLGDLLLSIPLMKNIKKHYPDCHLHLVCRKPFGQFFLDMDLVDQVSEVNKKDKASLKDLELDLKKEEYDLLICPHESFRSAVLCSKVNAKLKVSFRRWFSRFFFNRLVTRPADLPDVLRQTSLLASQQKDFGKAWVEFVSKYRGAPEQVLNGEDTRVSIPSFLEMSIAKNFDSSTLQVLKDVDLKNCIAIAPGSVWPTKRWSEENFVEYAKSQESKVLILGSPGERQLCEAVSKEIPGSINLAGQTSLTELYIVLAEIKYLICNDSGTMHMASAANCKTVAAFGPTTLDIGYRPWSNHSMVAQIDLKCRPCGLHGHKKCPIGTHECMKALKASQVRTLMSQLDSNT